MSKVQVGIVQIDYFRWEQALAVYHIHKHFGQTLIPDGAELMERFISSESELGSRRNAFLMLFNECEEIAIEFLRANCARPAPRRPFGISSDVRNFLHGWNLTHVSLGDDLDRFGDGFALLVLELTRKVLRKAFRKVRKE